MPNEEAWREPFQPVGRIEHPRFRDRAEGKQVRRRWRKGSAEEPAEMADLVVGRTMPAATAVIHLMRMARAQRHACHRGTARGEMQGRQQRRVGKDGNKREEKGGAAKPERSARLGRAGFPANAHLIPGDD